MVKVNRFLLVGQTPKFFRKLAQELLHTHFEARKRIQIDQTIQEDETIHPLFNMKESDSYEETVL